MVGRDARETHDLQGDQLHEQRYCGTRDPAKEAV